MLSRKVSQEISTRIQELIEEGEDQEEEGEEVPRTPIKQIIPVMDTTVTVVQPVNIRQPQHLIRRSSSAVERITMPTPQEEKKDGGDKALRPRFLQERSATLVHITPQVIHPSRVPRSKASAFLLGVVAKSKVPESRHSSLEPLHPNVSNSLHYVNKGVERGMPLRMAGRKSHRVGRQVSIGSSSDLLENEIPEGTRNRRVSASEEHMAAIVRALQASKQQMHQQLDILHSILRLINANERDDEGKRLILKEMVDVGMIPELAGTMREFRFHTGVQVAVLSILSALAEESPVCAYMMSEFNLEKLLQKTAVVHASQDRLMMLASNLVHAIEDSKRTVDIPAYQAEKAAKIRRQSATYMDMLVAAITAKPRPAQSSSSSSVKSSSSRHEVTRNRALIGSASSSEKSGRQFVLDVAPPALSVNYRLLFSQKLKRSEVLPLPTAENDSKDPIFAGDQTEKRDRPSSSPSLPLDLTSRSLATAIYSGGSIFVEPSPLSKRLPFRGSFSAGGVRRKLSVPRKIQRAQTDRLPPTLVSISSRCDQPPLIPEKSSIKSSNAPVIEDIVNSTDKNDISEDASSQEEDKQVEKEQDEEESYEDDFEFDGEKKMPDRQDSQIGSDGELLNILHERDESSSFLVTSTAIEAEAATTIQRCIRGVLVRRKYVKSSSSKIPEQPRRTNNDKSGRRGPKREGSKGKRIPLSARSHRQLQNQGSSRRKSFRSETDRRSITTTLRTSDIQSGAKSKVPAQGNIGVRRRSQETNNRDFSLNRSSQLETFSLSKQDFNASTIKVEPEHKSEDTEVVTEPPDPEILKQIQTLYAEGLQHHKENHLGLAIELYETALAIPGGRDFASLHVNLGSALMAQNKFSEALVSFENAKRIQPNNVKAIYNYSLVLLHMDRPQEAQRLLRRILELDPTHQKATIALSHLQSPTIH